MTARYALYAILIICCITYALSAYLLLPYPHEIDFAEGLVLQHYIDFILGSYMSPVEEYPHIVYNYPPLFYIATALVDFFTNDPLFAGRLISFLSFLTILLTMYFLCQDSLKQIKPERINYASPILGALMLILFATMYKWSLLMRVDTLAACFGLIGILFGLRALHQPGYILAATIFLTLAIFTKHTLIAPTITVFSIWLLFNRNVFLRGTLWIVMLCVVCVTASLLFYGTEFLKHLIIYNATDMDLMHGLTIIAGFVRDHAFLIIFLFLVGPFIGWSLLKQLIHQNSNVTLDEGCKIYYYTATLYLLVSSAIAIITCFKTGSNYNYFMETSIATTWCFFLLLQLPEHTASNDLATRVFFQLKNSLPIVLVLNAIIAFIHSGTYPYLAKAGEQSRAQIQNIVNKATGPIYAFETMPLTRAGLKVPFRASMTLSLISHNILEEKQITSLFKEHYFEHVILYQKEQKGYFTKNTLKAIHECYAPEKYIGMYVVMRPKPCA